MRNTLYFLSCKPCNLNTDRYTIYYNIKLSRIVVKSASVEQSIPDVTVEGSGGVPRIAKGSVSATASVSATIESGIEKSFSTGRSITESRTYEIYLNCTTTCPPNTNCSLTVLQTSMEVTYELETTIVRVDNDENPIGEPIKVVSNLKVDTAMEATCSAK